MKVKIYALVLVALAVWGGMSSLAMAQSIDQPTTIGIVVDESDLPYVQQLREEIEQVVRRRYTVLFPDEFTIKTDGSGKEGVDAVQRLVKDPRVDVIITLGWSSSAAAVALKTYKKPTIAMSILDPVFQGIQKEPMPVSGIRNFTFIAITADRSDEFRELHKIFPYKRIMVPIVDQLYDYLGLSPEKLREREEESIKEFDGIFQIRVPRVEPTVESVLQAVEADSADAVMLGSTGLDKAGKVTLIDSLTARKIPAFSYVHEDLELGVLATVAPKNTRELQLRRCALDVADILSGRNASTLPVALQVTLEPTVNLGAAEKLKIYPSFEVLISANLLHTEQEFVPETGLREVLLEALDGNPDLKASNYGVKSSYQDYRIALANLFPTISLNGTQSFLSPKAAGFTQAERMFDGNVALQQMIFSEQTMSAIKSQQLNWRMQGQNYMASRLDLILNTTQTYLQILMAEANLKVQENNRELTKKNLQIAKQRLAVGTADASDVYRWESSLATATYNTINTYYTVTMAKANLNQILNRDINAPIKVQNVMLWDSTMDMSYLYWEPYLKNPQSVELLNQFLQEESLKNSPELKALTINNTLLKRQKKANNRQRYIPDFTLQGQVSHNFYRQGQEPTFGVVDNNWNATVGLAWPILQGGSIGAKNRQYKVRINQVEENFVSQEQSLRTQVRVGLQQLSVSYFNLDLSRQALEASRKAFGLVQESYLQGKASFVSLLEAQNAVIQSEQSRANADFVFMQNLFKLERSIGGYGILRDNEENEDLRRRFIEYYRQNTED
ncbi:hypothetical protein FUAX_34470 [Fulvitalea axinellae]|uniref:Outer membrane protein TolC n=1 Tax=Fulvitalea axinellae TaxID=1182444 RepID=A0AAU9CNM6_9BACT|nr:hypothetical protein FUAX_34470 [Fulvitalea axinellae]